MTEQQLIAKLLEAAKEKGVDLKEMIEGVRREMTAKREVRRTG